jgi:hypothetical protein
LYQKFLALKTVNPNWGSKRISAAMGITVDIAQLFLARYAGAMTHATAPVGKPPAPEEADIAAPANGAELQVSGDDQNQSVSYRGARIRSIEDLLAFSETDTRIWEVERHVINKWEVGAKDPATGGILTEPLFQLKLWLRRKLAEQRLEQVLQRMLEQFKQAAPPRAPIKYAAGAQGMLEISIMDLHLGKYCWADETGRAYNPDITSKMFWAALEDWLCRASVCHPEQILFVVGNDFFNVDNFQKTTTQGTPQSETNSWQESFLAGRKLMVGAIERLTQVAPVKVLVVPGNHDMQRLWYLGTVLGAYFHTHPSVTIDYSCQPRKYVVYGKNLIGFCHGHAEKHDKLPMLMAVERPQDWAAARFREWHLGHFHSKKTKVFVAHQDLHSVQVRILPSICPPDAWHAAMGYTSKLAAEAYFWDRENGCVATFTHSPL